MCSLFVCSCAYSRYSFNIEECTYTLCDSFLLYDDIEFEQANIYLVEKDYNDSTLYCETNKKYFAVNIECKSNKDIKDIYFIPGDEKYALPDAYDGNIYFNIGDDKYNFHVILCFNVPNYLDIRILSLEMNDKNINILKKDECKENGFGEYKKL